MADNIINQQQFDEDVAAAETAGGGAGYANIDGGYMPSVEEVLQLLENMQGLTDEQRANLRASIIGEQGRNVGNPDRNYEHTSWDYVVFLSMIVLIVLVFALFGYKLYKSLMEKELKKQEKLKLKQSKKTKKAN